MAVDYPGILDLAARDVPCSWSDRDAMLYALGIGMGEDPLDESELDFVNDRWLENRPLKVVPTFATVVASGISPGQVGLDLVRLVDGAREVVFHRPMPASAEALVDARYVGAFDKGADKGAILLREMAIRDEAGPIATLTVTTFARGDGGFGGPRDGAPRPHKVPERAPDLSVDLKTRSGQALLYRLSGDRNPLHSDPAFARKAGFDRPILHGMCTFGITCRAVMNTFADGDPAAFARHAARFSSPVFPGETVTVDIWRDGPRRLSFEARIAARNEKVVSNGLTELR